MKLPPLKPNGQFTVYGALLALAVVACRALDALGIAFPAP